LNNPNKINFRFVAKFLDISVIVLSVNVLNRNAFSMGSRVFVHQESRFNAPSWIRDRKEAQDTSQREKERTAAKGTRGKTREG